MLKTVFSDFGVKVLLVLLWTIVIAHFVKLHGVWF
jgi:hypothetical protein